MSAPTVPDDVPVRCEGLTKHYGRTIGIEALDLSLEAGTVTGFLGPNGSGKTTVLRVLTGLLRPTSGRASLFGIDVGRPDARRRLGFMPADPSFYPDLTGTENLDLLASLQGGGPPVDRAWACEALDLDRDDLDRPVRTYSSGMSQKLALVLAVQQRPDLVILDEPANRLDPIAHRRFIEMIRAIAGDGRTVFLSSHSLPEVESACDVVAMVRRGRLLMTGSVDELTASALRRITVRLSRPLAEPPAGLLDIRTTDHVLEARVEAHRPDVLRALLDDPAVEDLLVEPASLEETFLHLYEGDR